MWLRVAPRAFAPGPVSLKTLVATTTFSRGTLRFFEGLNEPAVALFQEQWQLYRKFVDNNYFYHREVYGQLHRILVDEVGLAVPVPGYRLW